MDSALVACLDRVRHAQIHVSALKRAFHAYIAADAYKVDTQIDIQNPAQPEKVIYATLLKEPPAKLGLIVSDAINDLRGTLDNLVWALTVKHSGPPPDPIPRSGPLAKWRNIKFPTQLKAADWKSVCGNNLWGVRPGLLTDFEALQPYRRRKGAPHRDDFAILDELWNRDKHRHPALVAVPLGLIDVRSGKPDGRVFESAKQRQRRPLKGRAEIARIREVMPPSRRVFNFEMDVDFAISFEPAFESRSPVANRNVYKTLNDCRDAVTLALATFEAEFR